MIAFFQWDKDKAKTNLKKHGISFEEASTVFHDTQSLTIHDPLHSTGEDRFVIVGYSCTRHLLVVVHVDHGDRIRIISARRVTRKERKIYEEEKQ